MATQGLVSVCEGGKVRMKIIAGSDGMKAKAVADEIRALGYLPSWFDAMTLAVKHGFGGVDDLVVLTEEIAKTVGGHTLHERYVETFDDPSFNPRWKEGTADHVEIVDL